MPVYAHHPPEIHTMIPRTMAQAGQEYINPIDGIPVDGLVATRKNMSPVSLGWNTGKYSAHDGFGDDQDGEEQ